MKPQTRHPNPQTPNLKPQARDQVASGIIGFQLPWEHKASEESGLPEVRNEPFTNFNKSLTSFASNLTSFSVFLLFLTSLRVGDNRVPAPVGAQGLGGERFTRGQQAFDWFQRCFTIFDNFESR